ncbi:MAG: iron ABC transporter permease [Polyangiaceae bacterium]|nr:iron ABC transporter permease [Polyangiaceae bacterium]
MRPRWSFVLVAALALVALGTSLVVGAVDTSPRDVMSAFAEVVGLAPPGSTDSRHVAVLLDIRAPRVATGLLVGAALGAAGAALQGVFRNPLADPSLLGVSLGASLGAALVIVLGQGIGSLWATPAGAFAGGLGATLLASLAAQSGRSLDTVSLLLGGIAVQAFCGAAIGLLIYVASDSKQRDLTFWLLGSLGGSTWHRLGAAALPLGVAIVGLPRLARSLDALALGEAEASDLGIAVGRVRAAAVILCALGVGAAVAISGPIGFVGLVVPHLARILGGASHRITIVGSAIGGGLLLVIADTLARTIVKPAELPIGVVTAFLGAPFFYFLLLRRRRAEVA